MEKDGEKIAVEIKSFLSDSSIFDFHVALGQFLNYRLVLEEADPQRVLFLAIPTYAYDSFFSRGDNYPKGRMGLTFWEFHDRKDSA